MNNSLLPARILIVDDEDHTRQALARALELCGYVVETAGHGKAALACLERANFDLMLLDLRMPEMDGQAVMEMIRRDYPELSIIILTAYATLDSAIDAVKTGAVDYLLKPQSLPDIEAAVRRALNRISAKVQRQRMIEIIESALDELHAQNGPEPCQPAAVVETTADFLFDRERRQVRLQNGDQPGCLVNLTEDQCAILGFMIDHANRLLSSRDIACGALGYSNLSEHEAQVIVRPHILRLRRKLEVDPLHPQRICTVRGRGYVYSPVNHH